MSAFYSKVAVPKLAATDVDEIAEIVQIILPDHSSLNDLCTLEIEETLQGMSDTSTVSVIFLISILRCLVGNDEDSVGEGVYPMSSEEVALFLANQTGFGFPSWHPATKSMDILPPCSRYTKPTLACVVQAVCKSCLFLKSHFLEFAVVFFDSFDTSAFGICRPYQSLYLRPCTERDQYSASLLQSFTASRAIRRTNDLARPI